MVLFEKALIGLSALCPVFVTPGNHDSAVRMGYGGAFFAASGVHMFITFPFSNHTDSQL